VADFQKKSQPITAIDSVVFVYGTLMRGEYNHHYLTDQTYLGPHRTEPLFHLYNTGPYPAATRPGRNALHGELYRVDADCMARLDVLEDYPLSYTREQIVTPEGLAWIYLWIASLNPRWPLLAGDWRAR